MIYAPGDVRYEQRDDPTILAPTDAIIRLAASCVLGTGWYGAVAADVGPGKTVAVVGDGAVGLLAVMAAKQLGAERIIAMSRHESRQRLALEFGATDIITERGDEGVARVKDLTEGLGAHCVVEAVGTQEAMMQAIRSTRAGGHVGFVGVSHGVEIPGRELFYAEIHLHGGPAPVRRFLRDLIDRIWRREINPGKVFDLTLPLSEAPRATAPWTNAAPSRPCRCVDRPGPIASVRTRIPSVARPAWGCRTCPKQYPMLRLWLWGAIWSASATVCGFGAPSARARALLVAWRRHPAGCGRRLRDLY